VRAACVAGIETTVDLRVDRSSLWGGIATDEATVAHAYQERDNGDPGFHTVTVPAVRAASLIQTGDPPIDFATVDVEGAEIDVLQGLDLQTNRPIVLVIEALSDTALRELDPFLSGFKCRRARAVICNHFYVTNARDTRRLRGITINCRLTVPDIPGYGPADLTTHAWSPPATRTKFGFVLGKLGQRSRDRRHGL